MKENKSLYAFFKIMNATNGDYMKYCDAYIKFIESYIVKTPIHPVLVESKITKMGVQYTNNPIPEEN